MQNLSPDPTTKAMQKGRFQPHHLGNHLTDFYDTSKLRITESPQKNTSIQNLILIEKHGWSGPIPSLLLQSFILSFWVALHA